MHVLLYVIYVLALIRQITGRDDYLGKDGKLPDFDLAETVFDLVQRSESQNQKIIELTNNVLKLTAVMDEIQEKYSEQLRTNALLEYTILENQGVTRPTEKRKVIQTQMKDKTLFKTILLNDENGKELSSSKRTVNSDVRKVFAYDDKKSSNQINCRLKKNIGGTYIAFSAYLGHDLKSIGIDQIIKFDEVLYNAGHGYNTFTGVFTAPQTGVYFFTFTIHSQRTETNVQLVLDGNNVVGAVTHADGSGLENNMATNSAAIAVSVGQSVWVKGVTDINAELISSSFYRQVTFSGFLLA